MLCPVLTSPTVDALLAEHARLAADGVKLIEWRLDFQKQPFDMAALVARRPGPAIVTLRLPADGGQWQGDEAQRRALLAAAIDAGIEYVDLEGDTAAALPRRGKTQRIVSLHDFAGTPDDLSGIHRRLAAVDADVVKLATLANTTHDTFRMLELVRNSKILTVGLCMGELGAPTRLLAGKFGMPWTYCAPAAGSAPAPGQLDLCTMRDVYRFERIDRETELYAVIGDPIAHSRSPHIHNAAFAAAGVNKAYIAFRVPPAELLQFLDDAVALGFRGLSVTIPHKEAILARVTDPEPAVREIGAANTLLFEPGKVSAYNTDRAAAIDSLAAALQLDRHAPSFAGLKALVLGAGGAAKAIAQGLKSHGADVTISNRNRARADELALPLGLAVVDWDARYSTLPNVLVNCTPLGMEPHEADTAWDSAHLRAEMVVFDTVYTPERTRLIREAERTGCRVVTGVEMFVRQGARQFELFTGRPASIDVMRAALGRAPTPGRRQSIALIGYRGTGKTTVARALASRLGWSCIDADEELERRAGCTIAEMFATQGEPAFRDLESAVLADLVERQRVVISTGGGVVLREENRKRLGQAGLVVWLRARVATILARTQTDPTTAARRPNLTTRGGASEVQQLLTEREPWYGACADLALDTDQQSVEQLVAAIADRFHVSHAEER
jgi:3-dehydroquinate dehydratase/shikimate dehydrogenase